MERMGRGPHQGAFDQSGDRTMTASADECFWRMHSKLFVHDDSETFRVLLCSDPNCRLSSCEPLPSTKVVGVHVPREGSRTYYIFTSAMDGRLLIKRVREADLAPSIFNDFWESPFGERVSARMTEDTHWIQWKAWEPTILCGSEHVTRYELVYEKENREE